MYIPDSYLDELIASDIPSGIDLTTHVLGIGAQPGRMEYYTRDAALLVRDRGGCPHLRPCCGCTSASRSLPQRHACLRPVTCS